MLNIFILKYLGLVISYTRELLYEMASTSVLTYCSISIKAGEDALFESVHMRDLSDKALPHQSVKMKCGLIQWN